MQLNFIPPLAAEIHDSVLSHLDVVQLRFIATFDSHDDYEELHKDGARVEVWSDARNGSNWEALRLEEPDEQDSYVGGHTELSLVEQGSNAQKYLEASVSIPFSNEKRLSYTYRLIYPSGDIRWLGEYGQNGTIFLTSGDSRVSFKGHGWQHDGPRYSWNSSGVVEGEEIAKFNDQWEWTVWTIGEDSVPKFGTIERHTSQFSLAFLVPSGAGSKNVLPVWPLALSATQGLTLSFASCGLMASGKGSVLLQTYITSSTLESFVESVFSLSSRVPRLIHCHPTSGHIILASSKDAMPLSAAIIPLTPPSSHVSRIQMPIQVLSPFLSPTPYISIFSPQTSTACFVAFPSDEIISFVTDLVSGGRFIVSPVYNLSTSEECLVSLATPYQSSKAPSNSSNLPTPPPSPRAYASQPSASQPSSHVSQPKPVTVFGLLTNIVMLIIVLSKTVISWILNLIFGRTRFRGRNGERRRLLGDVTPQNIPDSMPVVPPISEARPSSPHRVLVEVSGGPVLILSRSINTSRVVKVELNGKLVLPNVKRLPNDILLLDLNVGERRGSLKIFADCDNRR